jgi:hypothetical protein
MSLDTLQPSHPRPHGKIGSGVGTRQAERKITTSVGSVATGTRRVSFLHGACSIKSYPFD